FRGGQDVDHSLFQGYAGCLPGVAPAVVSTGDELCRYNRCLWWLDIAWRSSGILIPGPVRRVVGFLILLESRQESVQSRGIGGTMQELAIEMIDRYDISLLTIDHSGSDIRARSHSVVSG